MTLILKSNATAQNALGNLYGYNGPMDYRAMLSFERGMYVVDGVSKSFDDVVSFARASKATYRDDAGTLQVAGSGEPRFHTTPTGRKGLLLEPSRQNFFASPTAPASQVASVPRNGNQHNIIMLRVEGTGSATLSVPDTPSQQTASLTATQGVPAAIVLPANASSVDVTITVSGSLSYAELLLMGSFRGGADTPQWIPSDGSSTSADIAEIKASAISHIIGNGAGTVVMGWSRPGVVLPFSGMQRSIGYVINGGSPRGGLYLFSTSQASQSVHGIEDGKTSLAIGATMPRGEGLNFTSGVAWANGVLRGGASALIQEWAASFTPPEVDRIILSGSVPHLPSHLAPNAVLTHCAIYDRALTIDELRRATGSWI